MLEMSRQPVRMPSTALISAREAVIATRMVGSEMAPTLRHDDILYIDPRHRTLNLADRIWAFSISGAESVRRLRRHSRDRIEICSDGAPNLNYVMDADEIVILGRVIRFTRAI